MSRKVLLRVSLLALLSTAIQAQGKDGPGSTAPLTIYTGFPGGYSADLMGALKAQLTAILGPIGLKFQWRDLKTARGNEVVEELVVVSFKGDCSMHGPFLSHPEIGTLGWTHMSDGVVLPFIDLFCDNVRNLIHSRISERSLAEQERVLGQALGRVMAHELYHVFGDTARHSSAGVAKGIFTPGDLVSEEFHFRAKEYSMLRNGRLRQLFQPRTSSLMSSAGAQ